METVGLDTGFFIRLLEGNEEAVRVWERVIDGELKAITSTLVLFELKKILLRFGKSEKWSDVKNAIVLNCEVVPIDIGIAEEGASVSHGTGLPAMDALIYTCIKHADRFYTTDGSFEVLKRKKKPAIKILRGE